MIRLILAAALCLPGAASASSWDQGMRRLEAKRYREAIPLLERAARADPGSPKILLNLGWAYQAAGRARDARRVGSILMKIDSDNPNFIVFMANAELETKRPAEAERLARRLLEADPANKPAAMVLARALFVSGRRQEALTILEDLLKRYPQAADVAYRRAFFFSEMGRAESALAEFERLLAADPANPDYRKGRARALVALGRSREAVDEWAEVVRKRRDYDALLNLGWSQWRDGRIDEARRTAEGLLQFDANNPSALRFMANLDLARGDFEAALALARRTLNLLPSDRDASLVLVKALSALQRPKEAALVLSRIAREHPEHPGVIYLAADFAMRTGRPAEALNGFNRLIAQFPNDDVYRLGRAQVLYDAGRFDEAVSDWRLLASSGAPNLAALRNLRDDAANRQAWREAIAWQDRLLRVKAPEPADWFKLAELYLATRSYAGALRSAEMAIRTDPVDINGYYLKATVQELLEDWPAVRETYQEVARRNPNSQRAHNGLAYALEAQRDYRGARREMQKLDLMLLPSICEQNRIREAIFLAESGRLERAQSELRRHAETRAPAIPVVLYHGVSPRQRSDSIWVGTLRDHIRTLRAAGYTPITVSELHEYYKGRRALPAKPIAVTFDDGRVDSFVNADPVLAESGFKATMFVQVSPRRRWNFYANAEQLTAWQATGRWDIQAHGYLAHDPMPIDGNGRKGHFFANRMWLPDAQRLETLEEFTNRVNEEYDNARRKVQELCPNGRVVA
ncbi:MAG: tetratricopeptide repeat protein, partial [Elusimicrobia bacterium]|nr:tetratricopeptide repeat protein [Elusimicrobiota bacterium]